MTTETINWERLPDGSHESADGLYRIVPTLNELFHLEYAENGERVNARPGSVVGMKRLAEQNLVNQLSAAERVWSGALDPREAVVTPAEEPEEPTMTGYPPAVTRAARYDVAKAVHAGVIVLLPVGDLYETFDADAEAVAVCMGEPVAERGGRRWYGLPAEALEFHLRTLLEAGHRVAVGDDDGEVLEATERLGPPEPPPEVLCWPRRPDEGEDDAGWYESWTSGNGEYRVVRREPLDGAPGWFEVQAAHVEPGEGGVVVWRRAEGTPAKVPALALAFDHALAHFQGCLPPRQKAAADAVEALAFAKEHGLGAAPEGGAEPAEEILEKSEIGVPESGAPTDNMIREESGDENTRTSETIMSETATMEPEAEAGVANMAISEADARQLAGELGWKTAFKDMPIAEVLRKLNGVGTKTPLDEVVAPTSPDSRALFKSLQRTLKAGGAVEVADTAKPDEDGNPSGPSHTAKKPRANRAVAGAGMDRFGCREGSQAAQINKAIGDTASSLDEIVKRAKLPVSRVKSHLKAMVAKGLVVELKSGEYKSKK